MNNTVPLTQDTCRLLFLSFQDNEYRRDASEDGGIPVFDTQTGELIRVQGSHGPDCTHWCCSAIPYELRCRILTEIDRRDGLQEVAEEEGWQIPNVTIADPSRYVEVPHITHAAEHGWLDAWAESPQGPHIDDALQRLGDPHGEAYEKFKRERIREHIIDWLNEIGGYRGSVYACDHTWFNDL